QPTWIVGQHHERARPAQGGRTLHGPQAVTARVRCQPYRSHDETGQEHHARNACNPACWLIQGVATTLHHPGSATLADHRQAHDT
ncbi:hypothetical protein, partial [Klebsiella pneumoniae]|uniref:hypothetical protein n=1 Tax=Klebsiella pneumoniae TaxID=573 RepID=UPI003B97FE07